MILRLLHITPTLLVFSQTAFAQDGIDPAKKAAIQELMAITGAEANRQQLTHTFTQQLITVLQANGISVDEQTTRMIRGEVKTVVDEQLENQRLQNKMYRLYARYFTLEEIEGLIAFNKSPIGAKANRVMPLLMRESMSAAQEWLEEIGPVISNRVRDRLEEQGISIKR